MHLNVHCIIIYNSQDMELTYMSIYVCLCVHVCSLVVVNYPPANAWDAGDVGFIPRLFRKVPWIGNGNPLQYSCLENFMHRGAWWANIHGVTKSRTWLSTPSPDTHIHTWYCSYVESKKLIQMNLHTKQKQTHRLWEQTYGHQRGKIVGRDKLWAWD